MDDLTHIEHIVKNSEPITSQLMLRNHAIFGQLDGVEEKLGVSFVDVNFEDPWGFTPLTAAAQYGRVAVVERLLMHEYIVIDQGDSNGDTPLIQASRYGHTGVVELLLLRGANPYAKNRDEKTAMDCVGGLEAPGEVASLLRGAICYYLARSGGELAE